jgi:hypothetical protein
VHYYQRTCKSCGYEWSVAPAAVGGAAESGILRFRLRGIARSLIIGRYAAPVRFPSAADVARAGGAPGPSPEDLREALSHCPRCGDDTFSQQRTAGRMPSD